MRCSVLTVLSLALLSATLPAQPAGYASRGVRAYLVNYNAVHGDRFLAEFAARRFVLIDEAGSADIPMMRAIAPDIPVLRYRDMVAIYPSFPEFGAVDRDEVAFMHSTEPSGLSVMISGDTATIAWIPDRRSLPVKGYRLRSSLDSLGSAQALVDSLITTVPLRVRLPKSTVFLRVDAELEDGSLLNYGFPVRWYSAQTPMVVWPSAVSESRSATAVENHIELRTAGNMRPDSIFIVADLDRSNTLNYSRERMAASWTGESWACDFSVDITGLRSNCGYEFTAEIWSGGGRTVYPAQGKWHTNVNNRVKNDTYGFYVMNVGSSTWRQATIGQILLAFSRQGYSGLFEDDTWYRIENYGGDSYPPVPYNQLEWRADLYGMLDSIRAAIAPRPAYFNGLYTDVSDSLLAHTEGGMTEGFAYTHWSGLVRGASWRNSCNRGLSAAHAYRKTWMSLGGAPFDDISGRLYALASYLMVADSLSMFANATSYQELSHFPEFDIPLGTPLESAALDVDTLAHVNGSGRYHRREFEHGTVVVNAGTAPVVYPDARGRKSITALGGITTDGGRIEAIHESDTLASGTARIYLNMDPDETLASPVIDSTRVEPERIPSDGTTPCTIRVLAHDPSAPRWRSVAALPLHVVCDAGAIGGPRELLLQPASAGSPEQPVWFEAAFTIPVGAPPDSARMPVSLYAATGLVTIGHVTVSIESGDTGNLLMNYSFEIDNNDDGTPDFWRGYSKGFDYDISGMHARSGSRSVHVLNDSLSDFRGVYVRVDLKQDSARALEISGWSKCIDVSGNPDNDYALYVDSRYMDGTSLYGQCARFATGTHDWEYASFVIRPEKPIDYCSVYVLFRRHTGEAWFDQLALRRHEVPSGMKNSGPKTPFITAYPNPARETLRVLLRPDAGSMHRLTLHDALGRVRLVREIAASPDREQRATLSLRGLHPGTYYLRVDGLPAKTVVVMK
jgi:hypothetical protein